mgnify:CR=1 FL=1
MAEARQRVKTQDPRDFAVQIQDQNGEVVGSGVAVDSKTIVTCSHVVEAALNVHPRAAGDTEIDVYFPQARAGENKSHRARVTRYLPRHDDDIVLLELAADVGPLGLEQIADIGFAKDSFLNPFVSYGYASLPPYRAAYARGTILGCVDCETEQALKTKPVQLESTQIVGGMSGAPVLDQERNLVIGLISETYNAPDAHHRDTAWAVDAQVLTLDPFSFPVKREARPKETVEAPPDLPDPSLALLRPTKPMDLHGAPPMLDEWVGRDDLLAALTGDWRDPKTTITALVGFGGEGKSSLVRKWLERIRSHESGVTSQKTDPPMATFWWSFYDEPSVEAFFEALLEYLSGGRIDTRRVPSASARMKLAARMLRGGRYLLVLDGFEVMQHQEGDDYGLVKSTDLRAFLEYLAVPDNATFVLITSRAPLLDLMPYTTATQRDVTRLSPTDGRALLRALGVEGPDRDLDRVVRQWDGHALTLSLLGSLLAERYDGDLRRLDDLPAPLADEDRYQRVHRVLRRYDEHLTEAERDFLKRFSAFRTPVKRDAFERIFRSRTPDDATTRLPDYPTTRLLDLIQRLTTYRILRYNQHTDTYTTHPLIRNHYFALFTRGDADVAQATHAQIKDYYLELAGDTPRFPTLDDLRPLIEVVHHACRAGAYDEGYKIYKDRIQQRPNRAVLVYELGAYETDLSILQEFFPRAPDGAPDLTADPQVSEPSSRRWILNEVGLCLMSLGRLRDAVPFYERAVESVVDAGDWHNASAGYDNLANLHIALGDLDAGAEAAREALRLAQKAENQKGERTSLVWLAWAEHLRGETEAALAHFAEAEALEKEISGDDYLSSIGGIFHTDTLLRSHATPLPRSPAKTLEYARRITEANLEICERNRWADDLSMCHRVLGDLDAIEGQHTEARAHYDEALRIARSISDRAVLIEALLARGAHAGKTRVGLAEPPAGLLQALDLDQAFSDLREALDLATRGGYRRYEADIRVALAWAHRAATPIPGPSPAGGGRERARAEAERARAISEAMGYHWGQVDAEAVLEKLDT